MMIEDQELESRVSALEEEMRRLKQKEYDRLTAKLEEEQYKLWLANVNMFMSHCCHPSNRYPEIEETR